MALSSQIIFYKMHFHVSILVNIFQTIVVKSDLTFNIANYNISARGPSLTIFDNKLPLINNRSGYKYLCKSLFLFPQSIFPNKSISQWIRGWRGWMQWSQRVGNPPTLSITSCITTSNSFYLFPLILLSSSISYEQLPLPASIVNKHIVKSLKGIYKLIPIVFRL